MPNSASYSPSRDWQHFERLCRALYSNLYGKQFLRWGRSGQVQNGIDLYTQTKDNRFIALQCKGRSEGFGKKLTTKEIDNIIKAISLFPDKIDEFIILTTAPDDQAITSYVNNISRNRLNNNECSVSILGWNSLSDLIALDLDIQKKFYGHWFRPLTLLQWFFRAAIIFSLAIGSYIGIKKYKGSHFSRNGHYL